MINKNGDPDTQFNSDKGVNVKANDTYTIKYQLSSYGESNVDNVKFFVLVPKGFTTPSLLDNGSSQNNSYTTQSIGKTEHGEEAYLVTTKSAPDYSTGKMVQLKANLTVNEKDVDTQKQTYNLWNQLVFGDAADLNTAYGAEYGGGETTLKMANGTIYNVVKNPMGIDNQQSGQITYTVETGNNPISSNSYEVSDVSAKVVDSSNDVSGSEQLSFNLIFNHPIENQGYIDVDLGLPEADGSTLLYDNVLGKTMDITYKDNKIGKIYAIDNHYRLVFNSKTNDYIDPNNSSNPFKINVTLNWGSGTQKASLNHPDPDKPLVYQYTDNNSLNFTPFTYSAKDDIKIGNNIYSSDFKVPGQYIPNIFSLWRHAYLG